MEGKKIALVTYYWPPAGGPGVQRWLKFVKYLAPAGYEIHVIIPENPSYPFLDDSLISDVPEDVILVPRPIIEPYRLAEMVGKKKVKSMGTGVLPPESKQSFLQRIALFIRGNAFVPDARILWVKPTSSFLEKYLVEKDIQTLITTGPPHSVHLIGMNVKRSVQGLRWIADFRDPWTSIEYHDSLRMTERTKSVHKRMESEVLNSADDILVTSKGTEREFRQITPKPIHVITNGFDSEVKHVEQLDDFFSITHVGSLLSGRNPQALWAALKRLSTEVEGFSTSVRLQLYGAVSAEVLESIKSFELENITDLKGYIPHAEVVGRLAASQVLLLIEANNPKKRCILPGKLFEYLSSGRPIVAVGVAGSDIEEILESSGGGRYFHYDDEQKIYDHLLDLFTAYKNGKSNAGANNVMQYHRKTLCDQLISLLESNS